MGNPKFVTKESIMFVKNQILSNPHIVEILCASVEDTTRFFITLKPSLSTYLLLSTNDFACKVSSKLVCRKNPG